MFGADFMRVIQSNTEPGAVVKECEGQLSNCKPSSKGDRGIPSLPLPVLY
jgi:hypothetical protein